MCSLQVFGTVRALAWEKFFRWSAIFDEESLDVYAENIFWNLLASEFFTYCRHWSDERTSAKKSFIKLIRLPVVEHITEMMSSEEIESKLK